MRDIPPNGMTVFFAFFLLTGVLIAIFMGDRFDTGTNPYQGVAVVQASQTS